MSRRIAFAPAMEALPSSGGQELRSKTAERLAAQAHYFVKLGMMTLIAIVPEPASQIVGR